MTYAWIDEQRKDYERDEVCSVLEVSGSGYRSWTRGGIYEHTEPLTQFPEIGYRYDAHSDRHIRILLFGRTTLPT